MPEHIARIMVGLLDLPRKLTLCILPGCSCHAVESSIAPLAPPALGFAEVARGVDDTYDGALEAALLWVAHSRLALLAPLLTSHASSSPNRTVYPYVGPAGKGMTLEVVVVPVCDSHECG